MSSFNNKVVVITGGGGVLCSAIARAFLDQGARVALLDINERFGDDLQANSGNFSSDHLLSFTCDVLSAGDLKFVRKAINDEWGRVDILINGAGGNHPRGSVNQSFFDRAGNEGKTFFDLLPEDFRQVFDLNFLGTFLPTQVFAQDMTERGQGCILNISSMNAFRPLTKIPAYSSAKAAVSNFTQWAAVHFAKAGIRVNALAPGFFLTHQTQFLLMQEDGNYSLRGEAVIEHTPMGRFGNPDDLLGAVLWLCGEDAKFVTGVVVPIDGGFSAYSGV